MTKTANKEVDLAQEERLLTKKYADRKIVKGSLKEAGATKEFGNKRSVEIHCTGPGPNGKGCKATRRIATSDLHQVTCCPDCVRLIRVERRKSSRPAPKPKAPKATTPNNQPIARAKPAARTTTRTTTRVAPGATPQTPKPTRTPPRAAPRPLRDRVNRPKTTAKNATKTATAVKPEATTEPEAADATNPTAAKNGAADAPAADAELANELAAIDTEVTSPDQDNPDADLARQLGETT